jgi:hypothetical protein
MSPFQALTVNNRSMVSKTQQEKKERKSLHLKLTKTIQNQKIHLVEMPQKKQQYYIFNRMAWLVSVVCKFVKNLLRPQKSPLVPQVQPELVLRLPNFPEKKKKEYAAEKSAPRETDFFIFLEKKKTFAKKVLSQRNLPQKQKQHLHLDVLNELLVLHVAQRSHLRPL